MLMIKSFAFSLLTSLPTTVSGRSYFSPALPRRMVTYNGYVAVHYEFAEYDEINPHSLRPSPPFNI